MDALLWSIGRADGIEILGTLWKPFLIGMILYQSSYLGVWLAALARTARLTPPFGGFAPAQAPAILVVIPSLLRGRDDLADLHAAAASVVDNHYPGPVVLCLSIDGSDDHDRLVRELERWARQPRGTTTILVARTARRAGKGVAVAAGLHRAQAAAAAGEIASVPTVFFNMDADSALGAGALERMAAKLLAPGRWTRQRPIIVASNVLVRRAHYWQGWRTFFTVRGQLALQVAREYMTSISVARHNSGLLPVTAVSGALYCTWTELHDQQARHATFMLALHRRDWLRWWIGQAPPSFAGFAGAPNVAATAGEGDDTWLAWLAMGARWRGGRLDLELPRSPLHALGRLIRSFFVRPIAYDPLARVYTTTPTTIRALFRQRVRWNASRPWLLQKFGWMPYFAWDVGVWVVLDAVLLVGIHAIILVALFAWPFVDRPAAWLSLVALGYLSNFVMRGAATFLAMVQDHDIRGHWHKLLALPLAGVFHAVFNLATTIVGMGREFFGFGLNTGFAPEETLAASHTGRVALSYRLCRLVGLTRRALRHGDVPPGWFWLGWNATPWTRNGYDGWTDPTRRGPRGGVLPHRDSAAG